jgi:hypothetical protein
MPEYFFCCKNASIICGGFILTKPLMFGRFSVQKYREDNHKRKFNPLFCSYITGLIEGDGTIIVPKTVRSPSDQANYGSIEIVFDSRDLPLAVLIQRERGFGSISKGVNACRLTIKNAAGLITLVELMNGYLRTGVLPLIPCQITPKVRGETPQYNELEKLLKLRDLSNQVKPRNNPRVIGELSNQSPNNLIVKEVRVVSDS